MTHKSKKNILYISYYGGISLKNVLENLHKDLFVITVLELRLYKDSAVLPNTAIIINGSHINTLNELESFLEKRVKDYDLIFTFSEVLTEWVASFSKKHSLPYSCDAATYVSRNKFIQREMWSPASSLKYFLVTSKNDLEKISLQKGVFKPINAMGSIGVRVVSLHDLKRDYDLFVKEFEEDIFFERFNLIEKKFIFEEVIQGDMAFWQKEYTSDFAVSPVCAIDGFICNGKLEPFYFVSYLPFFIRNVDYGCISNPCQLSDLQKNRIVSFIEQRINMLEYNNTIIHAEVILCADEKIEMVEVATRPGGRASQEIIQRTTHHNPVFKYVATLLSLEYYPYDATLKLKSKYASSIAVMPANEVGEPFPDTFLPFVDINRGLSMLIPEVSSTIELVSAKTLNKVKRGKVVRLNSATVYALLLLVNNSYEHILKDAEYIRKNLDYFFSD